MDQLLVIFTYTLNGALRAKIARAAVEICTFTFGLKIEKLLEVLEI